MTFELFPTLTPYLVLIGMVAVAAPALTAGALVAIVVRHRPLRRSGRQSVGRYYGRLLTGH